MVIGLGLALLGCAGDAAKETGGGEDTAPSEDTAPPEDSGPDSGDVDADGDGWTPNDGDCDDTLPHVHPGAPDYCDGLDANCDGESIPDGSCGQPGDATKMWTWSFEGSAEREGGLYEALGDIDADGRGDLSAASAIEYECGPVLGRAVLERGPRSAFPEMAWTGAFPRWLLGGGPARAGDVNGDGVDDVWASAGSSFGSTGAVFLFLGRGDGFSGDQERVDLAADVVWEDTQELEVAGRIDQAELNGDGLRDAVFTLRDEADEYWATLPGSAAPSGADGFDSAPRIAIQQATTRMLTEPQVLSDLDGDGFDEVAATTQRDHDGWTVMMTVEGEDLLTGGAILDVGHDAWYETGAENVLQLGSSRLYGVDPDTNGDGFADLVVLVSTETTHTLVYASGGVPDGAANDLAFAEVAGSETDYLWPKFWTDDVDDDGVADLMLNNNCVMPSHRLAGGGTFVPDEVAGPCIGQDDSLSGSLTDLTGDGLADWVLNQIYWEPPESSGETYNRTLIIEGFPIPWDDPSKW